MITISPEAMALIEEKKASIFIEVPPTINGCCIDVTECPSIHFGEPRLPTGYSKQTIQGVTTYVPGSFPRHGDFVIRVSKFLGFKRLTLGGWRLA